MPSQCPCEVWIPSVCVPCYVVAHCDLYLAITRILNLINMAMMIKKMVLVWPCRWSKTSYIRLKLWHISDDSIIEYETSVGITICGKATRHFCPDSDGAGPPLPVNSAALHGCLSLVCPYSRCRIILDKFSAGRSIFQMVLMHCMHVSRNVVHVRTVASWCMDACCALGCRYDTTPLLNMGLV